MNTLNGFAFGPQYLFSSSISPIHWSRPPEDTTPFKPFPYYDLETVQWSLLFGVCFLLGVGIGANDVSDSFATSVGTGTVTVTQAFILATVVEMMGSVASGLSGSSGKTLEVIDTSSYADNPDELVIGQIAMLVGSATWLMIATFYCMPVSSVHSMLGASIGFSFVLRGVGGMHWDRVGWVLFVWALSPLVSAIFTLVIFFVLDITILKAKNPVKTGLFLLPLIYAIVVFANLQLFFFDGSRVLHFQDIPLLYTVAISLLFAALAGFVALFVVGPIMRRRLKKDSQTLPRISSSLSYNIPIIRHGWVQKAVYWAFPPMRNDDQKAVRLFSALQVLTACFAGFAHGANDVTNCVAPMRELVKMYNQGYQHDTTELNVPVFVILLSTLSILLGIWTLGVRVMNTVGSKFSKMNPATGFAVEFGAALCGLVGNMFNIPQSMTHCLVGSIFGLGLVRSGPILEWGTVKNVCLSWLLTFPVSGLISAAVMYLLQIILWW